MRRGYTLFELLLVLALMVIVATIAFPVVDSLLTPNRLEAASDLLQAKWAEVRARALDEGRPFRCEFDPQANLLKTGPDDASEEFEQTPFPQGVRFAGEEPVSVIYLPDGTAQDDVDVRLEHQGYRPIVLRVRALTGLVTRAAPEAMP